MATVGVVDALVAAEDNTEGVKRQLIKLENGQFGAPGVLERGMV